MVVIMPANPEFKQDTAKRHRLFVFITLIMFSMSVLAARPEKSFPFTQAQNQDGAKYVWFIYSNAGFNYDYVPAKGIPTSKHFKEVTEPQKGDVAWWSKYVAIVDLNNDQLVSYLTAENERSLDDMAFRYGKPHYYRYVILKNKL
jgi:hypothetical protein